MTEREQDLQRALELYRQAQSPDAATRGRVWEDIERGIAPAGGSGPTGGAGGANGPNLQRAGSGRLGKGLPITAIAVLGAGALLLSGRNAEQPPAMPPPSAASAPAAVVAEAPPPAEPVEILAVRERLEAAAPQAAAKADATQGGARRPLRARAEASSSLAEELKLLSRAQAALEADEPRRALQLLRQHRARFRRGALAEEREATRVESLCRLGRSQRAERALRQFIRGFPGSPAIARVQHTCAEAQPR